MPEHKLITSPEQVFEDCQELLAAIRDSFVHKHKRPFLQGAPGKQTKDIPAKVIRDFNRSYQSWLPEYFRLEGKLKWHARRIVESEQEWEWSEHPKLDFEDSIIYPIAKLIKDTEDENPFTNDREWESAMYAASQIQDLMVQRINTSCVNHTLEWDDESRTDDDHQYRNTVLPILGEINATGPIPPLRGRGSDPIAAACGVIVNHPDWTDKQVAEEVGIKPWKLCRSDKYKRVRAVARSHQQQLPNGTKSGDGTLEAEAPIDDEDD